MVDKPRLAVFLAGLFAAVFLAWPAFFFDRDEEWRSLLAGGALEAPFDPHPAILREAGIDPPAGKKQGTP